MPIKKSFKYLLLLVMIINDSCNDPGKIPPVIIENASHAPGSFGFDYQFLSKHDNLILLKSDDSASQVIVSPRYQGKVFTSTANGDQGYSFGWVNYKAFDATVDAHMNAYGGENRFWLGPEGGRFSLYFKPGAKMQFENWRTPSAVDTESWNVLSKSNNAVALQKNMRLINYHGTELILTVDRTIKILNRQQILDRIGLMLDSTVRSVGYETNNIISNKGEKEWTESTGMPCIWLLDMFKPSPATVIVIPFNNPTGDSFSNVATTNYFGEISADRLKYTGNILFFKADGKSRGKLGIRPGKAKPVAGSYDTTNKVLTIILFGLESGARYLNQEWNTTKPAFSGDAVNAYNDGPLADGTQMGPFYEIESVSPAAFLKPNQSLTHHHSVFHFTGEEEGLDQIAQKLLGVSLETIKKKF
jgi:hypothetical protein